MEIRELAGKFKMHKSLLSQKYQLLDRTSLIEGGELLVKCKSMANKYE